MSAKKCSKCESIFECCNEKQGCWCEELFIDLTTLNKLKAEYDNCLCKECLMKYVKRISSNTEDGPCEKSGSN